MVDEITYKTKIITTSADAMSRVEVKVGWRLADCLDEQMTALFDAQACRALVQSTLTTKSTCSLETGFIVYTHSESISAY